MLSRAFHEIWFNRVTGNEEKKTVITDIEKSYILLHIRMSTSTRTNSSQWPTTFQKRTTLNRK